MDRTGNLYVGDANKHVILKLASTGTNWIVTTIAGLGGASGANDGTNSCARFYDPGGVAVDGAGNLFIADSGNNVIREAVLCGTNWIVFTIAGVANSLGGNNDGTNDAAQFAFPVAIAVDSAGNLFVGDNGNVTIRKIAHSGTNWITTTIAGTAGIGGYFDGKNGDAQFLYPLGVAVDAADNVYVADAGNNDIRKISPSGADWITTTIGGQPLNPVGSNGSSDGLEGVSKFWLPGGVAVDAGGNIYVTDSGNDNLRLGFIFPLLQFAATTNQISFSYVIPSGVNMDIALQSATSLSDNDWADVTDQWQTDSNGVFHTNLALTNSIPNKFFRLESH